MKLRFKDFTEDELYVLLRAFAESSYEFVMTGNYSKGDAIIHGKLLNEIAKCSKKGVN